MRHGTKIMKKHERKQVMAEALRLLTHVDSNLSHGECFRRAQLVLPADRRNPSPSANHLWSFFKNMRHLEASGHLKPAEHPPKSPAEPVPPQSEAPVDLADRMTPVSPPEIIYLEKTVVVKELPDYGRIPTSTLSRILLERLHHLEDVEAHMFNFTKALEEKRKTELAYDRRLETRPVEAAPKPEAIRICIVGLTPVQQHEVEARIANVPKPVKLKFYESNHHGQQFPIIVDHIITTRFTDHSWDTKAKQTVPSDRVHHVDGGISAIVQKIYDIASRQNHPALACNNLS